MDGIKSLLVLSALVSVALADSECSVDGLKCCLSEFLPLVSPAGIRLTAQRLQAACTIGHDTLECISDFSDQCVSQDNHQLDQSINETKNFISHICQPTSNFTKSVEEYEDCFLNSSESFRICYNKTLLPESTENDDESKWKAECCEYKQLRNCAVQSVENNCGATASQVLQDEIVHLNGAGLELACKDVFEKCSNAGKMLASSLLLVASLFVLRYL
ncbi:uncharacterized protein CEXT_603291 [Caerostris extrusa]|uniref:Uncharacterized protein n=1 Tax=Caerostris extrusa TaxID=172846 RepID=A0AAV4U0D2_CAEEX|nr:uncharacterized protein CEXT_603291 [Caerostris extrusa]